MLAYHFCRINELAEKFKEWQVINNVTESNLSRLNFLKDKHTKDFLEYVLKEYEELINKNDRLDNELNDCQREYKYTNQELEELQEKFNDSIVFNDNISVYDRLKIDELKRILKLKSLDELKEIK